MDKEKLLIEFEKEFAVMKKDLGFKSGLDDLDRIFFLRDFILKEGFVSPNLSRAVARRIIDTFMSWGSHIHSIIVPHPGSLISMSESNLFNDAEKEDLSELLRKILEFSSRNSITGITKDRKMEGKSFDDAVALWNELLPEFTSFMRKINKGWGEKRAIPETSRRFQN